MSWATEEPAEPRVRPFWRRKSVLALAALAAVGLTAAVYVIRGRSEVAQRLAEMRARGEPVTLEELAEYYPTPPADQNAGPLWLHAGELLKTAAETPAAKALPFLGEVQAAPAVGQPWDDIGKVKQFLEDNTEAIEELHVAAQLGWKSHYPVAFEDGFDMQLQHLERLRVAANFLRLEAFVLAHQGDLRGSARALRTGMKLSESLVDEPLLVSSLVRIATHRMVIDTMNRIGVHNLSSEDLLPIRALLAQVDFTNGLRRAILSERAIGISVFDNPESLKFPRSTKHVEFMMGSQDERDYLQVMESLIALADTPWEQRMDQTAIWNSSLDTVVHRTSILTRLMTPALGMVSTVHSRAETINGLAILNVAIAMYRQRYMHYPDKLEKLVPEFLAELPCDPSDGNSFTYQITDEGYLLFTPTQRFPLTPHPAPDAETGAHPDLVFRWPPLPDEPKPADAEEPTGDDPAAMNEDGESAPADDAVERPADGNEKATAEPQ